HALIVDAHARGDAEAVRRRPSILRVARVMQVHVRGSRPCRSVIRRCAHVDETYAKRSAIYSPVLDCSCRAVRARPNPVIDRLVAELEVVAAYHVGPIMRQLRLELRLVARGRPEGKRRTGGHAGVERKGGWIRSSVGL